MSIACAGRGATANYKISAPVVVGRRVPHSLVLPPNPPPTPSSSRSKTVTYRRGHSVAQKLHVHLSLFTIALDALNSLTGRRVQVYSQRTRLVDLLCIKRHARKFMARTATARRANVAHRTCNVVERYLCCMVFFCCCVRLMLLCCSNGQNMRECLYAILAQYQIIQNLIYVGTLEVWPTSYETLNYANCQATQSRSFCTCLSTHSET